MILDFAKSGDKASARAITLACEYFFFFFFVLFLLFELDLWKRGEWRIFFSKSLSLAFFFLFRASVTYAFIFSLSLSSVFIGTCARRA